MVSLPKRERFPYFKANDDRWKNSVRHNLSISPHFRKSVKARTGTGHLWTLALPPSARTIAANLAVRTTSTNTTNLLQYEFIVQHLQLTLYSVCLYLNHATSFQFFSTILKLLILLYVALWSFLYERSSGSNKSAPEECLISVKNLFRSQENVLKSSRIPPHLSPKSI